jgi:Raf kinase inhibitor-like YbhB/YbcL family protein
LIKYSIYVTIEILEEIILKNKYNELIVKCTDLHNGGTIIEKYTGKGIDVSPEFTLINLSQDGKTIAIILDDITFSIFSINHWIIWNIPSMEIIPGNIPEGKVLSNLGNAMQGIGYGRHRYKGPMSIKGIRNKYQFNIYALDCDLKIKSNSHKKQLVKTMDGHIIQYGIINGNNNYKVC